MSRSKFLLVLLTAALIGIAGAQTPVFKPPTLGIVLPGLNANALQAVRNAIAATPANRPTRRLFLQMIVDTRGDRAAMRAAIENANVLPKVQRICHVFGGYSPKAFCVRAVDAINQLAVSPGDQQMINMSLNDLWEQLGGAPTGGDLNTCGGRAALSVTNVMAGPSVGVGTAVLSAGLLGSKRSPPGVQSLTGANAASKVSGCRNAQLARLGAGLGFSNLPGGAGYQQAVANTQAYLQSAAASCRDSGNSLIAAPGSGGSTGTQSRGLGDALSWVAGATSDLASGMQAAGDAMEGCTSKAKCALSIVSAAVGAVSDANDLTGNNSDTAKVVAAVDTALDIAGAAVEVAGAVAAGTATVAAADAVLPAIAVGTAAYTVATPVGNAVANAMDPLYVKAADYINGVDDNPAPSGSATSTTPTKSTTPSATMPSQLGDSRSCADAAAAMQAFVSYCSQPGNSWQSYDCMSVVARLNGCADPGLVLPAPDQESICVGRASEAQKRQTACAQRQKIRDMLAHPGSGGDRNASLSGCPLLTTTTIQLLDAQRRRVCLAANVDDSSNFCDGARASQAVITGPTQPAPPNPRQ
jgi:hypothetical protein